MHISPRFSSYDNVSNDTQKNCKIPRRLKLLEIYVMCWKSACFKSFASVPTNIQGISNLNDQTTKGLIYRLKGKKEKIVAEAN